MKMLVSTDGVNFASSVNAIPGQHVDVLVTVSYAGDVQADGIIGFGSANFQPIVSNWAAGPGGDVLDPISNGSNSLGGMVNPQDSANITLSLTNPYVSKTTHTAVIKSEARDNGTSYVPAAPYTAGVYGRVSPFGRTAQTGSTAIQGWVHNFATTQTDQTGRTYAAGTYLRIAQANSLRAARLTTCWEMAFTQPIPTSGVRKHSSGRTTLRRPRRP
jgi:hypothetical protein